MPKRDSTYMAERRKEILDATFRCLDRLGIAATSTTEICNEAGISMGALYTHFKSKDEILLAMAERAAEAMNAHMGIASTADLRTFLLDRLQAVYRPSYAATIRVEVQLLAEQVAKRSALKQLMSNYRTSRRVILSALERIQAAGGLSETFSPEAA